jgi:PQQ-like domain
MEFRIDDPRDVKRSLWGEGMGQSLFWDDKRDAIFYSSEWNNEIFRLDRRTGEVNRSVSAGAIPEQPQWLYRKVTGSFGIAPMPHHGRDSMFVARWLTGSTVYEIDLERLTLRRQLEPRSGCIGALAVDEQYDRLFTASLWGVDVIDLRTGRVERRMRTGTGPRTPVIDTQNGLVYVPTTAEGRLRAFDRETLRPVGILPIGGGARLAHFSPTSGRLFAGNNHAYYSWDAAALAARLRSH